MKKHYLVYNNAVYVLQPPRRLEDYAAMKSTTENYPQQL